MGEENFLELNDVGMLQVFEEGDLSDGSAGYSIFFFLKSDFLDGNEFTSVEVLAFVYHTIGTFTKFLELLILIQA